jgi:hypothetical protein
VTAEAAKLKIVSDAEPKPDHLPPTIQLGSQTLDLVALRDCLLSLRDSIYCPMCRCPNWDMATSSGSGERLLHYQDCSLGKFSEILLRAFPKDKTSIKWKAE